MDDIHAAGSGRDLRYCVRIGGYRGIRFAEGGIAEALKNLRRVLGTFV